MKIFGTKMLLAFTAVSFGVAAAPASASLITRTFDIEASNFAPAGAPVDPVSLIFSATFDPTMDTAATISGLSVQSFNLPYSSEFEYNAADDILTIGTSVGSDTQTPEYYNVIPNSYGSFIGGASTANPFSFGLGYEVADGTYYSAAQYSVSSSASAVPETATWAMMIIGIGAIGGMMRRVQRKSEDRFTAKVRGIAAA